MTLYRMYRKRTFSQIFENYDEFAAASVESGIPARIKPASMEILYYLLLARFANSVIRSDDENRFKLEVFSTIYQHAPLWEKMQSIQDELRDMTLAELQDANLAIYNHALNPSVTNATTGGITSDTKLTYIDAQQATVKKRGKLEAYGNLMLLLSKDGTEELLSKFDRLFTPFAAELPILYVEDEDGQDS